MPLCGAMDQRQKRERRRDEMLVRITCLPPVVQHEAMLGLFTSGLEQLSPTEIREMRLDLVREFPLCPCGCDNRPQLIEILDGHLMFRDLGLICTKRRR